MKERYLYKAKRIDNGEWVVGNLLLDMEKAKPLETYRIYPIDIIDLCRIVDDNTICQCTGLKDRNGNLIWENDILEVRVNGRTYIGYVVFSKVKFRVYIKNKNSYMYGEHDIIERKKVNTGRETYYETYKYEVIGNIFDNPELLGSEEMI